VGEGARENGIRPKRGGQLRCKRTGCEQQGLGLERGFFIRTSSPEKHKELKR
jgi:hypothetical protein